MISVVYKFVTFFLKPLVAGLLLLILGVSIILYKASDISAESRAHMEASVLLDEIGNNNPQAKAIIEGLRFERERKSIQIAALSASGDSSQRSVLREMANEMAETNGLPYRARLAKLALSDPTLSSEGDIEAFFMSHATACEVLEIGTSTWDSTSEYMNFLEQAKNHPHVWRMIYDDPFGLMVWKETNDIDLLRFYHENRDWLADPLVAIDLQSVNSGDGGLAATLKTISNYPDSLRIALEEGELGVYGIAVMTTHGSLVDHARVHYDLCPIDVISVIFMNPIVFFDVEDNPRRISEVASWLATIERQHSTVWFAASETPLALQLHQDAPHVSSSLLEKYGGDDIAFLIYQHFSEPAVVAAAAEAIDVFGDAAIYVFARYNDPEFVNKIGDYLVNEDIGIRIIPFILRFQDDTFNRVNDNIAWVDRYFNKDGTAKDQGWIQYLPGGSAVKVVQNWSRGHPNEWSELGWATVDLATVALAVASFGASEAKLAPARATAIGSRAAAVSARSAATVASKGSRVARSVSWKTRLAASAAKSGTMLVKRVPRLAGAAKAIGTGTLYIAKPIWGTIKLTSKGVHLAWVGGKSALTKWSSLSKFTRTWIYRGVLGATLYLTLTQRTLPNIEQISSGIGELFAKASVGALKVAGDALLQAFESYLKQIPSSFISHSAQSISYWMVLILIFGFSIFFLYTWYLSTNRKILIRRK